MATSSVPWLGIKGKFVTDELRTLIAFHWSTDCLWSMLKKEVLRNESDSHAGELDVVIQGEPWVLGGDIIVSVDGQDVKTSEQYAKVFQQLTAEAAIELESFGMVTVRRYWSPWRNRPNPPGPVQHQKSTCLPIVPQAMGFCAILISTATDGLATN